jgi:hypothetical protein
MVIAASSTRYSPLDGTALGTVSFASPAQAPAALFVHGQRPRWRLEEK